MVLKFALNTLTLFWYSGIALIIYLGWMISDQRYVVAESGIGYWLGIIGGLMMLLLLVYPVRKRRPRWKYSGSVKFWFKLHMIFGIAGPVLIIFHSGFRLGSLNGMVAFFSMIIVALSGLVGRYFYRRIHHGLYGEKVQFEELYHKDDNWEEKLVVLKEQYPEIIEQMNAIEESLVQRHTGINRSVWFYESMRWKLLRLRRQLRKTLKKSKERKRLLGRVSSLISICNLGLNEILFSYWHIFHFPLFIMLVISGITHVVVVHFY